MAIQAALDEQGRERASLVGRAGPRTVRQRLGRTARPRRLERGDRLAIALFVALPLVLYLPFTLAGHPILPGDDLTQNFPLRVLAGEQLRAGHLPTWDPLVWSGTPLLAGWNGGSMFPATWLFAILPSVAAWTVAYVINPMVAALGVFALLRQLGTKAPAATVGALAFTYTGFMSGQTVHLGLVQGTALMPWTLVGLELLRRRLAAGEDLLRLAAPVALLGAAAGLTVLAGDPRAVTTTGIADLVYLFALLLRPGARRPRLLGATLLAGILGVLLSAVQWLPGIRFVHASQRAAAAYGFFGAGSLSVGHLASFLLVPYLFGGNGNFGLPTYAGTYNLPELTIGAGVLATVAFMAYLPTLAGAALGRFPATRTLADRLAPGGPASPRGDDLEAGRRRVGVWYALALVGALLSLGTSTPLGHLLVHVPVFGGERLQNRNAALVDLALVVLLAFLVDDLLERRNAGLLRRWWSKALCLVPLAAMVVLVLLAYVDPSAMRSFDAVSPTDTWLFTSMTPVNLWQLALVAGATALILRPEGVTTRRGRIGLLVLVAADLGLFVANASYAGAPSSLLSGTSAASRTVARLAGQGRIALYDPLNQTPPEGPRIVQAAGAPDLNVVADLASVQGYGSLIGSAYDRATFTHGYENLRVGGLSGSTFDLLDLRTLLTVPSAFATPLAPGQAAPTPGAPVPGTANLAGIAGTKAAVVGGPYGLAAHAARTFLLPSPSPVESVHLLLDRTPSRARPPRLQVVLGVGRDAGRPVAAHLRAGSATALLGDRRDVLAITVWDVSARPVVLDAVIADTGLPAAGLPTERLALDGPLQGAIHASHWRYQTTIGSSLAVWENLRAPGPAWLEPAAARTADPAHRAGGTVRTVSVSSVGDTRMLVATSRPALLVRSEAFAGGWTARLTPVAGGPTRTVKVRHLGLVQAVPVPPGRYEVTWHYGPPAVLGGLLVSVAGLAGLVALAGLALVGIRRRRRPTAVRAASAVRASGPPEPPIDSPGHRVEAGTKWA